MGQRLVALLPVNTFSTFKKIITKYSMHIQGVQDHFSKYVFSSNCRQTAEKAVNNYSVPNQNSPFLNVKARDCRYSCLI